MSNEKQLLNNSRTSFFDFRSILFAGAVFFITILAYLPAMQGGFIWDDDHYVTENLNVPRVDGIIPVWTQPFSSPQYYPMVFSSFWLEYRLWGLNPTGYHVVNILLHALCAIILFRILQFLGIRGAWFAAVVFAVHPINVETVAWITERKNVLSLLFYLSSGFCLLKYFGLGNAGNDKTEKYSTFLYVLALFLFICGLLSKTVIASLPAAILVTIWWKRDRIDLRQVAVLLPFFILGAGFGLTTAWLERHHVGAVGAEWELAIIERCLIAGRALWFYTAKLFWPSNLMFNYPRWEINAMAWWQYLFPAGVAGCTILFWRLRHRLGRAPLAGILLFTGTLFPALGFLDVYPFRYSFVADHFQYHAGMYLIVLAVSSLVISVERYFQSRYPVHTNFAGGILPVLLIVVSSILTWHQTRIYQDSETLYRATISKNPDSWFAYTNLGVELNRRNHFEEAKNCLLKAMEINPGKALIYTELGYSLSMLRQFSKSVDVLQKAVDLDPEYETARTNLAFALSMTGNVEEAESQIIAAIKINDKNAGSFYNLGTIYFQKGKTSEAVDAYLKALALDNRMAKAHYQLGVLFLNTGDLNKAIYHYKEAIKIKSNDALAHNGLAAALERNQSIVDAISHYKKAIAYGSGNPVFYGNLGRLYYNQKSYKEAVEYLKRATMINPGYTKARLYLTMASAAMKNDDECN